MSSGPGAGPVCGLGHEAKSVPLSGEFSGISESPGVFVLAEDEEDEGLSVTALCGGANSWLQYK